MNRSREEVLFALALEKPVDKRPAFLDAMCEGDAALRQRLDALIAAHEQSGGLPGNGVTEPAKESADEAVGQTIGRYKLREKIGEGGCGTVLFGFAQTPSRSIDET
jgi:eukaryotic-like serine/threonine-protein kinase